jgi:hypothetical protein
MEQSIEGRTERVGEVIVHHRGRTSRTRHSALELVGGARKLGAFNECLGGEREVGIGINNISDHSGSLENQGGYL